MIDKPALKEQRINKILTQYRESPHLLGLIGNALDCLLDAAEDLDALPEVFDIDTATGYQLTLIGNWLGWPREHCEGKLVARFGFDRPSQRYGSTVPVLGFCEGAFFACPGGSEFEPFVFEDDELYRRYLKVRQLTLNGDFSRQGLVEALKILYGEDALILREQKGMILASPGRLFTQDEVSILHLSEQILPIAMGVRLEWAHHEGSAFGFGAGWGEICNGTFYQRVRRFKQVELHDEFGFGPAYRGFCEGKWLPSQNKE